MKDKIKKLEERKKRQFLIDRNGKTHKYKDSEWKSSLHDAIAKKLFPNVILPADHVNKLGWVTVGNDKYVVPICRKDLSQAQINTLDKLGLLEITKIIS